MKLTGAIQEALLCLLCYDDSVGGSAFVRMLVPSEQYDPYFRDIAGAAVDYIDKYKQPPKEHTLDIIEVLKTQKPDTGEILDRIFASMQETKTSINREYVVAQARNFCRYQRIRSGIASALDHLEADRVDEADAALQESRVESMNVFDPGLRLSNPAEALAFLDKERDAFPCGIKEIDAVSLGPTRKRLHLFGAPTGGGKSWWLIHLTKTLMLHGYRGVYVTLELDEEEIAQRMIQSMFSVSKRDQQVARQEFRTDELGRFVGMDTVNVGSRPHLTQPNIRTVLTHKLEKLQKRPPVLIKEFPTGMLTVPELKAYLMMLENMGMMPDYVILDYADLMSVSAANYRLDLNRIYKELRGIAVERNIAMITATQVVVDSASKTSNKFSSSESKAKVATADTYITYNQTEDEHELGLARLYLAKGRTDQDQFSVLISQAYALGQFCMSSARMNTSYWDAVEREAEDGSSDDL